MSLEILSIEGFRIDGRRWNELRHFTAKVDIDNFADGSSYVEQGNTKVICMVHGPIEPNTKSKVSLDRERITIDISIAAFSSVERKKRTKSDKRIQEYVACIQKVFEKAIQTGLHPRSEINICIQVLAQDGGMFNRILQTCINAVSLALINAGIPMYDYVSASTVGSTDTDPLLDLNAVEENSISWYTVAILGKSEDIILLQTETRIHMEKFEHMLSLALHGCQQIYKIMDNSIRNAVSS
ncbi:exosome non-catalytic core subunit SKI6 [Pneumocystis jirovecii RU7]|uniref:Ribosomal RNA-processing protein 41 n=1 Tax=Pneumocystis jirovecii (strain RU7) TaxID=1408657 RepID=A0A0W4ZU79_PNEJ7|nr:exosome non-catalytic core subunit SKI6 [Pneumocystis jirovecii RU7]KTW31930.1 hypothetical protein T551_00613 [Pneumocystis jirovecii RU7]